MPSIADVVARVCDAAFGRPLVTNVLRGQVVEAIVALALDPQWRWCAADYSSWDFERSDGVRLEIKQSAYRQSWAPAAHGKVRPAFDTRARTGRWEGATFVAEHGRPAHLYAFAYHDVRDESADHRDPAQWAFYVVRTDDLPAVSRLSLPSVSRLASPVRFDALADLVNEAADRIATTLP